MSQSDTEKAEFQEQKMHWLLKVAGYTDIKPLALITAVAMANRANSETALVWANLSTLAKDLDRSDDTGLSRGAAELVKLGFLTVKSVGKKSIWTVVLEADPKPPEQPRSLKGCVKTRNTKVVQVRNYDGCAPAQHMEGLTPSADRDEQLRTYATATCAPAQLQTIPEYIPEGKPAHAGFSRTVVVETEEQTTAQKTDQDVASDRALLGAVLPEEQCELIKDVFEHVSNRELDILGDVIVTIGLQNFTTKLVNLAVAKDRGHSSTMTVGQWVEASGWRPISGEHAAGVHHHA